MTPRRKLIEVALPLEAINKESAREKSIRHGHPSTLHLWWARRPLALAGAELELVGKVTRTAATQSAQGRTAAVRLYPDRLTAKPGPVHPQRIRRRRCCLGAFASPCVCVESDAAARSDD